MKKILSFFVCALMSLASFAQTPVTYTVDKYSNTLPSDAGSVDLQIYPVNFGAGVDVNFIGGTSDVTITDSENHDLSGSSPVTSIDDGAGCTFTVNFNNAQIATDIATAMTNEICYMVSFAVGSLEYDDNGTKYTNKFPVTAYLYFWDAVDFTSSTTFEPICEETTTLNVAIEGKGHHLPAISYTSGITLNGTPKAVITGTDINGNPVNVEAAITGSAGSYTLTFDQALPQDNGTDYTVTIPADAFKASQSKSPVFTYALDVKAHPVFTLTNPADMDPQNTFTVPVAAAADHTGETIEIALSAGSSNVVTISNGTNTYAGTATYAAGVATVTTTDKIAAGDYTVTFAAGNFKANLCESGVLTVDLHVEDIVWTYTPDEVKINDATTEFQVTIGATFENNPVAITDQTLNVSLNGTTATMTFVSQDATTLVRTYKVTLNSTISADDVLTIAAGDVKAMASENEVKTINVKVVPYVYYSIDTEEILIDTEDTEFTFDLFTKDVNGDDLDRLISYVGATSGQTAENAVAFNDGHASVFPTLSFPANNKVTANFGTTLPANNYQLNIPKHTVYADANDNDDKMFVNFRVMNHINIYIDPITTSMSTSTEDATINLLGKDVVDNMDATVNVKYVGGATTMDILNPDATVAKTADLTVTGGNVLDLNFAGGLAEGMYVVVVPAGSVKANASKNDNLMYYIGVEDFEAQDVTINEQTLTFNVEVSDEEVFVLDGSLADIDGTPVTLSDSDVPGCVKVTMPATLAKGTYTLTIGQDALQGQYANLYEDLTCTVTVIKEFFFVDAATGKTTTAATDVVEDTYDALHYTRTFGHTNFMALYLPFPIAAADVEADVEIFRISGVSYLADADGKMILNSNDEPQPIIALKKLKAGESTVANKPYVVRAKAPKTVDWTFAVTMKAPAVGSVKCSTVFENFEFTGNIEHMKVVGAGCITPSGGKFAYTKATDKLNEWRWYCPVAAGSETENSTYVKVSIDGDVFDEDGEATALFTITDGKTSDGAIYNVAGQKLNQMQKGINIVNGKKILK